MIISSKIKSIGETMSQHEDEKSRTHHDDLEYNDGLGDLLREKEHFEFSWLKTLTSVLVIVLILYIGITILFKVAKSMVESPTATTTTAPSTSSQDTLVDEVLATSSVTEIIPTENPTPVETAPAQAAPPTHPIPTPVPVSEKPKPKQNSTSQPAAPMVNVPAKTVSTKAVPVAAKPAVAQTPQATPDPRLTKKVVTHSAPIERKVVHAAEQQSKPASTKSISQTTPSSEAAYKVIAGSFISKANADDLKRQLSRKGIETYIWTTSDKNNEAVYRVQVGSFKSKDVAQKMQSELNAKGVETYIQSN